MTDEDGHPYPADLNGAKLVWDQYVRRVTNGEQRGYILNHRGTRVAAVDDIHIVDDGPGEDVFVVLAAGRDEHKMDRTFEHKLFVLDPALDEHAEIEEAWADGKISNEERNRREGALWRNTLRPAVLKYIRTNPLTSNAHRGERE